MAAGAMSLAGKRRGAAAVLWTERLAQALAPSVALLVGFAALAWLGVMALLPPLADLIGVGAVALLCLALGWAGLARVARPTIAEVDRRLERFEPHRPLATLADRPAFGGGDAIWQAHCARALGRVPYLTPGGPRLGRSTAALLAGAAVLAVLGLAVAGSGASGRLWGALVPRLVLAPAPAVRLQAWILPPRAMGLAPIFLRAGQDAAAPPGSRLTVSVVGGIRQPSLVYGSVRQRLARLDRSSFQGELVLTQSGTLEVWRHERRMGQWRLTVAPDRPPLIAVTGAAAVAEGRLHVPWRARDDYGLAGIGAELRLRDRPGAAPVVVTLPVSGLPLAASGGALPDLTAQPWAGLPVLLRYVARDSGGQRGVSADVAVVLPERAFLNPVARALIGVRRGLVVNPAETVAATAALDRLSGTAGGLPAAQWLNLRAIASLLVEQPSGVDEAEARLWQLALQIEDAGVADAKQQLAQARDALRDALAAPPSAAQQRQVEALTRALQQAMQQYLAAMEKQAARAGQAPPEQAGGKTVDAGQLQQMAKEMEDAAKAGRLAEAQQRLQQLGALLDGLRQSGTLASKSPPQQSDPALDKLLADQGALRDHADRRLSDSGDPRTSKGPETDPDEAASQADPGVQRQLDAKAQAELRARLGLLAQQKGEQTGSVPDGLARADGAMRDAQGALAKGDDQAARTAQQRALDGLRGAGKPGQQAGNQPGAGQPGAQPGPGTDPLGRSAQEGGGAIDQDAAASAMQGDAARSRALRDELRRRAADRTRPQSDLDYIQRLLSY